MNSSKINSDLHWSPKVNFEDGLTKTIDWYLKNRNWWQNMDINALSDIPWKR